VSAIAVPAPVDGPSSVRLYALEAKYELLRVLRMPGFAVPTILFPAMFYIFFGVVFGKGAASGSVKMPAYLLATYGTFGVMGPALFGFGVALAVERGLGWLKLKRASPMPPAAYLVAKLAMCVVFAAIIVTVLAILGITLGGVRLPLDRWLLLYAVLVPGTLPFCALGLALGSVLRPQAAPAVVNLIYFPMSFLSGLWIPLWALPKPFHALANVFPSFHLGELALSVVGQSKTDAPVGHALWLVGFTMVFFGLALAAWRRAGAE